MTKKELFEILVNLPTTYQHFNLSENIVNVWFEYFKNEPLEIFRIAFIECEKNNSTGFPSTPGQVNEWLKKLKLTEDDLETADEAWHDAWHNLAFISPLTERALQLMDFANRGMWLEKDLPYKKREFINIYNSLKDKYLTSSQLEDVRRLETKQSFKLIKGEENNG